MRDEVNVGKLLRVSVEICARRGMIFCKFSGKFAALVARKTTGNGFDLLCGERKPGIFVLAVMV